MKNIFLIFLCSGFVNTLYAQDTLPKITVKNTNGRIVVSWMNDYKLPVANISIQRSYDSLRNYSTIGSVLNPQNVENGYTDATPPYNKMYYRLSITFEGGTYVITTPVRPVKIIPLPVDKKEDFQFLPDSTGAEDSVPSLLSDSAKSKNLITITPKKNADKSSTLPSTISTNRPTLNIPPPPKPVITYPSQRIFTSRDQNVVIYLPNAGTKNYVVTFFDEDDKEIFQLNKLSEEYLIIEKVNFVHSGWFHFELKEDGELIEKNKFFIPKDSKKSVNEKGNR